MNPTSAPASKKLKKVLTFSEECAVSLRCLDDRLDRLFQHLKFELREVGIIMMPKWDQHELVRDNGATRYITQPVHDKHGQSFEKGAVWLDFSIMPGDEPGVAVCSVLFQFERYAADDNPAISSLPRIKVERKRDIDWPDQGSAVWLFGGHINRRKDELVTQFRDEVLAAISP